MRERPKETGMADLSASGREQAAKSGTAMMGGRFPIKTMADMRNAIMAVGLSLIHI